MSDEGWADSPCEANPLWVRSSIPGAFLEYGNPSHQNFTSISISYIVHFGKNINFFIYIKSFQVWEKSCLPSAC